MCGAKRISWEDIGLFAIYLLDRQRFRALSRQVGNPLRKKTRLKIDRIRADAIPIKGAFLDGLVDGRGAQSTDPRDKVFAIMGLTNAFMYPNYSNSFLVSTIRNQRHADSLGCRTGQHHAKVRLQVTTQGIRKSIELTRRSKCSGERNPQKEAPHSPSLLTP